MAALENLGLEEDEPAPPPPPAKNPSAPAKHPASPGIAALDNLDMELEDEPAPPPKPSAEKKTAPEPMKPLAPISKGVAIFVECPACERKLRVPEELLGKKVKCPGCGGTFVGEDKTRTPAPKPPVSAGNLDLEPEDRTAPPPRGNKPDKLQLELDDKPRPPPTAPSDIEEMEEISSEPMKPRPVRAKPIKARDDGKEPCPYCGELIKQGATRCKHCGEDLDEEDDDRPSRRGKSKRSIRRSSRDAVPHRASMVMTLGIISVSLLAVDFFSTCCCGVLGAMLTSGVGLGLGIPAWIMGQKDLAKMRDGLMDPSGRGSTQTGWICGMIGTILHGLGLIGSIILLIFVIIIQGASLMSTGTGFGRTPSNTPGRKFEVPRGVPRLEEDPPERIIPVPAPAAP